jgi:hypothetical protein
MRALAAACGLVLGLQLAWLASDVSAQDTTIRLEGDGLLGPAADQHRGTSSGYGYEGTPPAVIPPILELAGIRADDVVYEPGCGDARVLIAAIEAGAMRGLGVDIDPDLAEVAFARVRTAGLGDKIEIRWGNALGVDMSQATVVFLFMGEAFNLVMRPMLRQQLKVGSRVISNDFGMGDWKPDRSIQVDVQGRTYVLHLWTITQELKEKATVGR